MARTQPDSDKIQSAPVPPTQHDNWPDGVTALTWNDIDLLGIHKTTRGLYWDGQKLVTERRLSNFERGLAIAGLLIALIGVLATVVQAWAAIAALP